MGYIQHWRLQKILKILNMEEATKLAIENGGYIPKSSYFYGDRGWKNEIMTDPLFWQALGKALGWKDIVVVPFDINSTTEVNKKWSIDFENVPEWKFRAHRWLDAHFQGQEAEDAFWKELTNK